MNYSEMQILSFSKPIDNLIDQETVTYVRRKVKRLLAKMGRAHLDHEDIAQEVLITLYERQYRYDPNKAKKRTFIYRILHNKVLDIIRHKDGKRHYKRREIKSLSERIYNEKGKAVELGSLLMDQRSNNHNAIQTLIERLPSHLRSACEALINSSGRNTHRELKVSRHRYYKILRQLRAEIHENDLL
jgi:RNA polymerase sigma factor (sigma-70 family)